MSKSQIYCSCIICKLPTTLQNLNRHVATHDRKLNNCKSCGELTKNKKFCSKSCSALISNSNRTIESYKKQATTLLNNKIKSGWVPKEKIYTPIPLKKRICSECGKLDETKGHFQSDKCMFCNDSLTYREKCKFTFNLKNFPNEFDLLLLQEYGMFNPKTNKNGVSRDHRLSINHGKINKIDPSIMSHPANCKLMLQSENKAKQHSSSITLKELLILIELWESKYLVAVPRN